MHRFPFYFTAFIIAVSLVAGCGTTSQERVATYEQAAEALLEQSRELGKDVDEIVVAIEEADAVLAALEPGSEQVAKVRARKDELLVQLGQAREAQGRAEAVAEDWLKRAEAVKAKGPDASWPDEVALFGDAVTGAGTVVGGPWGAGLGAAGTLIGGLAAVFQRRRRKDASDAAAGLVRSVQSMLDNRPEKEREMDKMVLRESQDAKTEKAVRKIKAGQEL